MIKKLTLINFQIHKRLEIEFDKHFTVIIGGNNRGKSSIIRAINWVFYNSPVGDWMRRINEDNELETAKVKIVFNDGMIITREKGEKINKYIVDGDEYENFGYGVPEKVLEKLKIYPLKTNKEIFNINLSMQDERPFLIHESSPVKASIIDSLTGNSIIQKSISDFNKEITQASKDQTRIEQEIVDDEESLKKFPDLEKIDGLLEEYWHGLSEVELKENWIKYLEEKKKALKDLRDKILNYKEIDVDSIEKLYKEIEEKQENKDDIVALNIRLQISQSRLKKEIPNIEGLDDLYDKFEKKSNRIKKLYELFEKKKEANDEWNVIMMRLEEDKKELEKFYKENPTCPTCGKGWK